MMQFFLGMLIAGVGLYYLGGVIFVAPSGLSLIKFQIEYDMKRSFSPSSHLKCVKCVKKNHQEKLNAFLKSKEAAIIALKTLFVPRRIALWYARRVATATLKTL